MSERKSTPGPWSLLCSESRGRPRCLVVLEDNGNEMKKKKSNKLPFIVRVLWAIDANLVLNTISTIKSEQYHAASITGNES